MRKARLAKNDDHVMYIFVINENFLVGVTQDDVDKRLNIGLPTTSTKNPPYITVLNSTSKGDNLYLHKNMYSQAAETWSVQRCPCEDDS